MSRSDPLSAGLSARKYSAREVRRMFAHQAIIKHAAYQPLILLFGANTEVVLALIRFEQTFEVVAQAEVAQLVQNQALPPNHPIHQSSWRKCAIMRILVFSGFPANYGARSTSGGIRTDVGAS